jgi:hypothetical protein
MAENKKVATPKNASLGHLNAVFPFFGVLRLLIMTKMVPSIPIIRISGYSKPF